LFRFIDSNVSDIHDGEFGNFHFASQLLFRADVDIERIVFPNFQDHVGVRFFRWHSAVIPKHFHCTLHGDHPCKIRIVGVVEPQIARVVVNMSLVAMTLTIAIGVCADVS
jgi:hypothetical protein